MSEVMTAAERWQRVQSLCDALDGVPEANWRTRLRDLESDPVLRAETLAMLAAMRDESAFVQPVRRPPLVAAHPEVIGGVRILERLGSGGSGEVFRGVRSIGGVEQTVAVKRFHPHRTAAADFDRFAREQRMLAALTHPDIVRIIDAGVEGDGRPYLVMELAQGDPITAWCDERRTSLRDRLVLFLGVCDAVQSAHQRLIVHLDLKPGNILVTTEGRPKLLDFGTAKLTGPGLGLTVTEPLTLQYASPERLRGEPVSVACDVYSLGLILYELLGGGWPFRRHESLMAIAERAAGTSTPAALPQTATQDAAERRSTNLDRLKAALGGDLEAIVARALSHDPLRRYALVTELADDIRRHLDGKPVRARPPGLGYRLAKFVRRNAWQTASAALLVVGLAVAAVYSAGQARDARAQASRAEAQNQFLTSVFTLAGNDATSQHDMTVRQLLVLANERVSPELSDLPDVAVEVDLTLAQGFLTQGASLEAASTVERARDCAVAAHDIPREALARAMFSYIYYLRNDSSFAVAEARRALSLWRTHRGTFSRKLATTTLGTAATTLAYVNQADTEPAADLEACLALTSGESRGPLSVSRSVCLYALAAVRVNAESRFADADRLLSEAAALQRRNPVLASSLAPTLQLTGLANRAMGRFAKDEAAQREAYDTLARLRGPDSLGALWQRAVWATSLVGAGRAEEGYREAMTVLDKARALYPKRGAAMMWTPLSAASVTACSLERDDECETLTREALETLGPNPSEIDSRVRTSRGLLGLVLARRGQLDEARPLLQAAVDGTLASKRASVFLTRWQDALAKMAPGAAR